MAVWEIEIHTFSSAGRPGLKVWHLVVNDDHVFVLDEFDGKLLYTGPATGYMERVMHQVTTRPPYLQREVVGLVEQAMRRLVSIVNPRRRSRR